MKKVWARIGVSFDIPDEKYKKLLKLSEQKKEKEIGNLLFSCNYYPDGESYFPDGVDDNPPCNYFDEVTFTCDLLKLRKTDIDLNKIWIYKLEDCCCGIVIADDEDSAKENVINAYSKHYSEFDPEYAVIQVERAVENSNVFLDCPNVIEVSDI